MISLTGAKTVLTNLKKWHDQTGLQAERGIAAAANYLRNQSMALVPVQTGNLKGSCGAPRNVGGPGFKADYVVYYNASYAIFVHEDLVAAAPPARAAHGKFFNIKHADEIASASHRTQSGRLVIDKPAGTVAGGMFRRGEKQQAKYLEQPMREKRKEIFEIIRSYMTRR